MKFIRTLKAFSKSRVTGVSTPFGGVQWEHGDAEDIQAQRIVDYLSDRRVLFNDAKLEIPHYCVESVQKIREFLTSMLMKFQRETLVRSALFDMLGACQKFNDAITQRCPSLQHGKLNHQFFEQITFFTSLGELRGAFGIQLSLLAETYGIKLSNNLVKLLPTEPEPPPNFPPWLDKNASKRLRTFSPPLKEAVGKVTELYRIEGLKLDTRRCLDLPKKRFNYDQIVELLELLLRFSARYAERKSKVVLRSYTIGNDAIISVCYIGISLQSTECDQIFKVYHRGVDMNPFDTGDDTLWKCRELAEMNDARLEYKVQENHQCPDMSDNTFIIRFINFS